MLVWDGKKTTEYFKNYDKILAQDKRLDLLRLAYGYVMFGNSKGMGDEPAMPSIVQLYANALGDCLSVAIVPYSDGREHREPAYHIPFSILKQFRNNPNSYRTPVIGKGQSISFYCCKEGMVADGIEWLGQGLPTLESIRVFYQK